MWRLLLIVLLACAPNRTFYASQAEVAAMLKKIVVSVNVAVECEWLFISEPGHQDVYVLSSTEALKEDGFNLKGFYNYFNGRIDLETVTDYNHKPVTQVLLHEIGHAVGLDHTDGVMVEKFVYMNFDEALQSFIDLSRRSNVIICVPLEKPHHRIEQ